MKQICENCEDFRDLLPKRKCFTKGHCTGHRKGSVVNATDTCKFYTPKKKIDESVSLSDEMIIRGHLKSL